MLHDLLIYLPTMICFFWLIVHCILAYRTTAFPSIASVLAVSMLYFAIDGYCSSTHTTPEGLMYLYLINPLVAPALIPCCILYLGQLRKIVRHPLHFIWITVPIALFAVCALLMTIIGQEQIIEATKTISRAGLGSFSIFKGHLVYQYYFWSSFVLRCIVGIEMVFMYIYMFIVAKKYKLKPGSIWRFLFKKGEVKVLHLQMFALSILVLIHIIKVFAFRNFLDSYLTLTAVLAILMAAMTFLFGLNGLFSSQETITMEDVRTAIRFNYNRHNKQKVLERILDDAIDQADPETLRHIRGKLGITPEIEAWEQGKKPSRPSIAEAIFNVASDSDEGLVGRFQKLMKEKQLFLKPGLSLDDVATELETNRTYVSKMVNNAYNMGFPELLNILRVDYAQHYIILHSEEKQESIASACGFFSASSFNNTFKRITGMTPKMWAATSK